MTKKEKLQSEYERIFGIAPDDSMTIKYLEEALKDTVHKKDDPIQEELVKKAPVKKSRWIRITNGRITKNITKLQWKNMQDSPHKWKPKVNEPIEVQKLNKDGKAKK